ncbi:GXWXG domain-containing protein [Arenibacter sp. F26102]|uniref:GXWXG domain-containing protein n=1 Tax=Arenibacter sp. F26102 TaxID=2926416 RepID=UPI001FF697FD|nr:GXWXG domain-containing protein [Arenibacter sp. F26102]MCK0145958.1 GXWXG domain-containing protein [Arenibacter sp. F26102]
MNLDNEKKVNKALLNELLINKKGDISDVLRVYDQLEPVSLDFMMGRWTGSEIATGHSLDGMLVPSGWYGKMFISPEEVHPLVFFAKNLNST